MLYDKIQFAPDMPIKFQMINVKEYPFHIHSDALEIIFVVRGTFEMTSVNNILQMGEGSVYINCPNELHRLSVYADSPHVIMLIHIDIGAYRADFPDIDTYQFANGAVESNCTGMQILGNYIKKLIPGLLDEKETQQINFYEAGKKILKILIQEFQCYYLGKYYPETSNIFKGNELQLNRIRRVVDYIYRNYNKQIKIEDLANMEHISTYHLTFILKNGCGVGFRMFLNMARVERSAIALLEDQMGLQQIAYECGFSKYEYFYESFKKVFRMTPKQYKQKYINKTIAVQKPEFRELERSEKELLLQKFYSRYEEIKLDLNNQYTSRTFKKTNCVNLTGFLYDHIICYPLLKQLKREISLDAIGIDTIFLSRYKNRVEVLHYILLDFRILQVDVHIYVPDNVSLNELKAYLESLDNFETIHGRKQNNKIEFIIAAGKAEENGSTKKALSLIYDYNFTAYETGQGHIPEKSLFPSSGYMPCYLLDTFLQKENFFEEQMALLGGECSSKDGRLALLSSIGVKTPIYYLLYLLERMENALIVHGKMHFITGSRIKRNFQILIYYYDERFDGMFENVSEVWEKGQSQQSTVKQECDQNREVTIHITNISGPYVLRKYKMTAEDYTSKYSESSFLSFGNLSKETVTVLNGMLAPDASVTILEPKGDYSMELRIQPFEILLLSFEKL